MTRQYSKLAALAAAAMLTCAAVNAAPVVIDSEQKANAAGAAAQRALSQPLYDQGLVTFYARGIAEHALMQLAATTTPIRLINSRNGITLACATSGNLTARMARAFPRVLKLQWQACKYNDLDDYPRERNGSAEIVLLSDTFAPKTVAAIRFGTLNADFTDSRHIEYPDQITDELRSFNLRMLGQIPMVRAFPLYGLFVGPFAFELTGFYQEHSLTELPGSGQPLFEQTSRTSAEFLIVSGATTYNTAKTHSVEDLRLHFGKVTHTYSSSTSGESSNSYTADGFRVRREADYVTFSGSQAVDGKIDFQYSPLSGNCLNGAYTFKTRAPLVSNSLYSGLFDAGDLLINGSTTARFYSAANVPPTLPVPQLGMLVHLDVRNVGSFNYDASGLGVFAQNSQCYGW